MDAAEDGYNDDQYDQYDDSFTEGSEVSEGSGRVHLLHERDLPNGLVAAAESGFHPPGTESKTMTRELEMLRRLTDAQRQMIRDQKVQLDLQEQDLMEYRRIEKERVDSLTRHLKEARQERQDIAHQSNKQLRQFSEERAALTQALADISQQLKSTCVIQMTSTEKTRRAVTARYQGSPTHGPVTRAFTAGAGTLGRTQSSVSLPNSPGAARSPSHSQSVKLAAGLAEDSQGGRPNASVTALRSAASNAHMVEVMVAQVEEVQKAVMQLHRQVMENDQQLVQMAQEKLWLQDQFMAIDILLQELGADALRYESKYGGDAVEVVRQLVAVPGESILVRLQKLGGVMRMLLQRIAAKESELIELRAEIQARDEQDRIQAPWRRVAVKLMDAARKIDP